MIKYFIHNGIAVSVLCIGIVLFGVLAIFQLPIQLTPNVQEPTISVTTIYPGATPQDVEQDILVKQEEFLRSVPGLKKMTSTAELGMAVIELDFPVGFELNEALIRVSNALAQVPSYPENVDEPSLSTTGSSDQPVAWFSVRARPGQEADIDVAQEFDFVNDTIKTGFERIPGVASVQGVYGGSSRQMQVFMDPAKVAERGLTIFQIREAIRDNNRDVPGGDLEEGKRRYNVRTTGRARSSQDIENIIITVRDGTPIHVRDVAYARMGVGEKNSVIRHNGRQALAMGVRHQPGTNLLVVMEQVRARMKEFNDGVLKDKGMFMTQVTDDTEYVGSAVAMVRNNMLTGGILALITLMLFLQHLRSTLVVGLAVPLCLLGSLFFISLMGRSINVITLAGLAFSIGSVLDNSIVVLENIFRHKEMGKDSYTAAEHGISEVWTAIFSATVTNVVVFLPIINLQEQAGQLFRDLAIAITSTNLFSFVVAVLVIPCCAARLLRHVAHGNTPGETGKHQLFGIMAASRRLYFGIDSALRFVMGGLIRRLVLVGAMVAMCIALFVLFLPKTEYLPEGNQNSIFAFMIPPQGYGLQEMSGIGRELENRMRPYVEGTLEDYESGKLDGPPIRDFFFVAFPAGMFLFTRAKDDAMGSRVPPLLLREMGKIPGIIAISQQQSIFDPGLSGSRGIELDIIGPDMQKATGLAFGAFMKSIETFHAPPRPDPGVEVGQPQLTVRPKWDRAAELGISASAIGYGAWVLGDGAYVDDYYEDGKKRDLYMYSTMGAFDTISSFDTVRISAADGRSVPLSDVVDISFDFVPEKIRRVDEQRAVTLTITPPADTSLEEAIGLIQTNIVDALQKEDKVPPGYSLRIGGSSDKLKAIREALSGDFLLAIVLVYLVLVLIFRAWGHPFTILLSVPIGISGGVIGLAFLNWYLALTTKGQIQSLDVLTMLGFVILLGSIVNNPILIVEQALNFMKEGMETREAIIASTMSRIRPIMMTTGTTIFGLAPLVFLPGAGSELYRGLGVVTFGGLLLGTITTIFFIPSVMSLLYDLVAWIGHTRVGRASNELIHKLEED